MNWWHPDKFEQKHPYLMARMAMIRAMRGFFDGQGFYEVETPILQVSPCAEAHLHGFKTQLLGGDLKQKTELYLHTSPEFAMKKLMVAGVEKMYQICHVFRNGEDSTTHSPEFTMIEWYRANRDYMALMDDCENLVRYIAHALELKKLIYKGVEANPLADFERLSVCEAFIRFADIDLTDMLDDCEAFAKAAQAIDIRVVDDDSWDDIFFAVMDTKIEPHLGQGVPTILYDYPASMAALSRKKPDDQRFAERFELYICGLELANAFSELTDAKEQRARYEAEMALKTNLYGETYPIDHDFLAALEYGMPESAGIALGVDRLAMLISGAESIDQVLWTSFSKK